MTPDGLIKILIGLTSIATTILGSLLVSWIVLITRVTRLEERLVAIQNMIQELKRGKEHGFGFNP
jgi:hypothetical protein